MPLLVLTVTAYLPLWNNHFVDLDDTLYITANPDVSGGLSWSSFGWAWATFTATTGNPCPGCRCNSTHFFSGQTADGQPILSALPFDNLCWHCGSTLLLFTLLQRLTGTRWRSFLVAALFALHPLHVESVAATGTQGRAERFFFGLVTVAYIAYAGAAGMASLSRHAKPVLAQLDVRFHVDNAALSPLLLDYRALRAYPRGGWCWKNCP